MGVTPMSYSGKLVIPFATPEIFSLTQISTSDPKKPPIFESFQTCGEAP